MVEALVALAIVAIMAGLVFDTVSQTSHSALVVADRRAAVLLARSVLAAATVETAIAPVPERGTDGPFAWSITGDRYDGAAAGMIRLEQVVVTITLRSDGKTLARLAGIKVTR
jgi:type II secretory pathway pseudopilin PulG